MDVVSWDSDNSSKAAINRLVSEQTQGEIIDCDWCLNPTGVKLFWILGGWALPLLSPGVFVMALLIHSHLFFGGGLPNRVLSLIGS